MMKVHCRSPFISCSSSTRTRSFSSTSAPKYLHASYGSFFTSEALPGAVPPKQNSPQQPPYGLYPELVSGNAFTAPRHHNRYSWLYRIRPSVMNASPRDYEVYKPKGNFGCEGSHVFATTPNQLRFPPFESDGKCDFIDGIFVVALNGSGEKMDGATAGTYSFNKPMGKRVFRNNDADMMLLPQEGGLKIRTEMGVLIVDPLEMALIPKGLTFNIEGVKKNSSCKGYLLENFGEQFVIPELGVIGISSGNAHPRHFLAPSASFLEDEEEHEFLTKFQGGIFKGSTPCTPFDVVGWYGNYTPFKYDLRNFMAINTVTYDHPDPSIGAVMSSYTGKPGVANIDFVIFPPRYVCGENTFRPPWYHRNCMSEFMGLLKGAYDAKKGFVPGACSIHNAFTPHGPDKATVEKGTNETDTSVPERYANTLAFMWESDKVWQPTQEALAIREMEYINCWDGIGIPARFNKKAKVDADPPYPFDGTR